LVTYDVSAQEKIRAPHAKAVLEAFYERFKLEPTNEKKVFSAILKGVRSSLGVSGKELFLPLRMALTGTDHGPELDRILPLLNPQVILMRLERALSFQE